MSLNSNARSHAREFAWNQGRDDYTSEEARLMDLAALRDAVEELISEEVSNCRRWEDHDNGLTWQQIADALGMTSRQAAYARYGR